MGIILNGQTASKSIEHFRISTRDFIFNSLKTFFFHLYREHTHHIFSTHVSRTIFFYDIVRIFLSLVNIYIYIYDKKSSFFLVYDFSSILSLGLKCFREEKNCLLRIDPGHYFRTTFLKKSPRHTFFPRSEFEFIFISYMISLPEN